MIDRACWAENSRNRGWSLPIPMTASCRYRVVVIALICHFLKFIILDLATADARHILSLAAAIVALGIVYWLIRHPSILTQ